MTVEHEWLTELDFYKFNLNGFDCEIKRHPFMKHLNGYVYLTKEHQYYGLEYNDMDVMVHGGLTFSTARGSEWKIGFDCAHYGDIVPATYDHFLRMGLHNKIETYKNVNFVKSELERLTKQLSEVR